MRRFEVALGALLHDIGKLAERAGAPIPEGELSPLRRELSADGAHLHAAYSAWVLSRLPAPYALGFAARHHRPTSVLESVVAVAERHASRGGASWADESSLEVVERRRRRLEPALSRVRPEGAVAPRDVTHLPLRPLSFRLADVDPAAGDGPTSADLARDEYLHGLWDEMERGLAALPRDPRAAIPVALALLERLAARVPAAPAEPLVDLSLHDHSRVVAALATALYVEVVEGRDEADRALVQVLEDREALRFTLCMGEVRGEHALYGGLSAQVGPGALTGRSAFVALCTDAIADRLLAGLELPATSLLYAAGSRFLLLLPHGAAEKLPSLASEVDLALLEIAGGTLHFAWGAAPLALADLAGERLSAGVARARAALEASAEQPFADLLGRAHGYESLFRLPELPRARCGVCGADLEAPESACGACARFEALGRSAARARAFARVPFESQVRAERLLREHGAKPVGSLGFEPLGRAYIAVAELPESAVDLGPEGVVLATGPEAPPGAPVARRVGLVPPPRRGGDAPCGSLAQVARGARRWGVLAVDLDDVEQLLWRGFSESERTLTRLCGLSRAVHHFFAGYAASLAVRDDAVHVTRVGGDELWAVAPWDHLPGLALAIRDALHRYTGGNLAIGLSAGIALGEPSSPVGEVVAEALAALTRAQSFVHRDGRRKDGLSFLGQELAWSDAALGAELAQALADASPRLRESLLARLRAVAACARGAEVAPGSLASVGAALSRGRWTWRMIVRLGELARTSGPDRALVERVRRALIDDDWDGRRHEQPLLRILELSVRWCRRLTSTEGSHERRAAPR